MLVINSVYSNLLISLNRSRCNFIIFTMNFIAISPFLFEKNAPNFRLKVLTKNIYFDLIFALRFKQRLLRYTFLILKVEESKVKSHTLLLAAV